MTDQFVGFGHEVKLIGLYACKWWLHARDYSCWAKAWRRCRVFQPHLHLRCRQLSASMPGSVDTFSCTWSRCAVAGRCSACALPMSASLIYWAGVPIRAVAPELHHSRLPWMRNNQHDQVCRNFDLEMLEMLGWAAWAAWWQGTGGPQECLGLSCRGLRATESFSHFSFCRCLFFGVTGIFASLARWVGFQFCSRVFRYGRPWNGTEMQACLIAPCRGICA